MGLPQWAAHRQRPCSPTRTRPNPLVDAATAARGGGVNVPNPRPRHHQRGPTPVPGSESPVSPPGRPSRGRGRDCVTAFTFCVNSPVLPLLRPQSELQVAYFPRLFIGVQRSVA